MSLPSLTSSCDLPATPYLSLSDVNIDALFHGRGIPLRGLIELSGEAGSGKTALSMNIALNFASTFGRIVRIVNTEGPYPAARLTAMAEAVTGSKARASAVLDLIQISEIHDAPALEAFLEALTRSESVANIGLVIIDSIAAPLRADLGATGDAPERARWLLNTAVALLRLNAESGVAAVVLNQVTDVFTEGSGGGGSSALDAAAAAGVQFIPRQSLAWSGSGRWTRPALGPAWGACVTHRMMLSHPRCGASSATATASRRGLCLMRSPLAPAASLTFELGVRGVENTDAPILCTD